MQFGQTPLFFDRKLGLFSTPESEVNNEEVFFKISNQKIKKI